jgi:hypothetical protein
MHARQLISFCEDLTVEDEVPDGGAPAGATKAASAAPDVAEEGESTEEAVEPDTADSVVAEEEGQPEVAEAEAIDEPGDEALAAVAEAEEASAVEEEPAKAED